MHGGAVLAKNESSSKPDQRLNLALAAAVSSTTVPPPSLEPPVAFLAPKNQCGEKSRPTPYAERRLERTGEKQWLKVPRFPLLPSSGCL